MESVGVAYPLPKSFCTYTNIRTQPNPRRKWNALAFAHLPTFSSSAITTHLALPIFSISENTGDSIESVVEEVKDPNIFQKWQRSVEILKEIFTPAPNSPAAGGDLTEFIASSALLLLVFWLGNYVVPDMIFKNTIFRKTEGDDESTEVKSSIATLEESKTAMKGAEAGVGASNVIRERKAAVGFGSKLKSKVKRPKS